MGKFTFYVKKTPVRFLLDYSWDYSKQGQRKKENEKKEMIKNNATVTVIECTVCLSMLYYTEGPGKLN
jgi:hypothetical protein